MSSSLILGVIIGTLFIYVISIFNALVDKKNEVKNALSQIDIQLTRRYDLIPNLVAVTKKYLQHESETLIKVINARTMAVNALKAQHLDALQVANKELNSSLAGLFAIIENYPELKANEQMMMLSEELSSTENRIAFSRQYYNDSVTNFNTHLEHFPASFLNAFFKFSKAATIRKQSRNGTSCKS